MCFNNVRIEIMSQIIKKYFISLCLLIANLSFTSVAVAQRSEQNELKKAVEKGRDFLKRIQRQSGAIRDTTNPLFDVWETIIATTALYETEKDTSTNVFQKAIWFLRRNENTEGLICHNEKCNKQYCLETTSAYLMLNVKMGLSNKVRSRFEMIRNLQKQTGEWEVGNPDVTEQKDFPSVTSFVLWALGTAHLAPIKEIAAYEWLTNKQNKEGHWGVAWEYYNCPAYAIWPLMSLNTKNKDFNLVRERTKKFILNSQNSSGSWFYSDTSRRGPSAELQTALILNALQNNQPDMHKTEVEAGIKFLLNSQGKDGSWDGGYFPVNSIRYTKREFVFATSLALLALQNRILNLSTKK